MTGHRSHRLTGDRLGGASGWLAADPCEIVAGTDIEPGQLLRLIAAHRPTWMTGAECARPEHAHVTYHPTRGQSVAEALAVCARCTVIDECRGWALDTPDPTCGVGIAAGMTAQQRRTARRTRRPRTGTGAA